MVRFSLAQTQVAVFKALAHPTRLRIVEILATEGKKCVCELVVRFVYNQSTISKHLSVLKSVGILNSTKDGLNVTYDLNMTCVYQFMKCIEQVESGLECATPIACAGQMQLPARAREQE